ncbi:MAG: biotin/lipoyl-containing protein, partial [Cyanobacteria bacterium J06641_5]
MSHEIFMPALSSTMETGKIVSWEKSPGDKVSKGETVLVVESDKADMDVESFYDGYLAAILVEAGGEAPVGAAIALLAETEADIETVKSQAAGAAGVGAGAPAAPAPAAAPATPAPVPVAAAPTPPAPANASQNGSGRTIASPRARKLAKEFGVSLASLSGSGPYGRIVAADVEAAAGKAPVPTAAPVAIPAPVPGALAATG